MKLLFDQNLSYRLCDRLADLGVTMVHVRAVGLEAADNARVWDHAKKSVAESWSRRARWHRCRDEAATRARDTAAIVGLMLVIRTRSR